MVDPTAASRVPRHRWGVGQLLEFGVPVNHFDRTNFAVAAPQLQHQFGLNGAGIGLLIGVFFRGHTSLLMIAPSVTGIVVGVTESFVSGFLIAGVELVIGIVLYVFLLDRFESIPAESDPEALYADSSV